MNLFFRTLRSFTRKEKVLSLFMLTVFVLSTLSILFWTDAQFGSTQKSYSEGLVGEITHLNPVFTEFSEADTDISSLIFSGLVRYNALTGTFDEDIATHTLSEDQLTYTFTLRNNVFWHDGEEVTADDIFFTYATVIQSPEFDNPILKSNFEGVKIEQVNTRTVSFTLSSPNSFFFTSLAVGLLPEHLLGEVPVAELDTHDFNQLPVGTGPYQVLSPYEINGDGSTSVSLEIFPQYYGNLPQIEKLRFVAYPSAQELVNNRSVWNGAARIRQSLLDEMNLNNLVTYQYELPQYTALFFNTDAPFLSKNKERLGISKAIDKEEILEAINYRVRIDTPLLELNQEEWLFAADTNEAQGALFDAGWKLEEGATVRSNEEGESFSLRLLRRDFGVENALQEEVGQLTADLIVEQLGAIGVEVTVESYPLEVLEEKIKTRDYDILLYGQSLGYNQDTFAYWHSSQVSETGLNLSNYINPEADFLIESIRGSFDEEKKQELLQDLAETIAADVPAVFLYTPSYYYLVDTKVTGVEFDKLLLPKDRFSTIHLWTLN
ncbi:MAG: peptide ABC transporter substrate-binding protein [Candidatus Gracilibacteria bacterium]|jgi:peptide/nickel transport system substrate-binding protein